MNWGAWLVLGIAVGMLLERCLVWFEGQCANYEEKLRRRRELDEFWSER